MKDPARLADCGSVRDVEAVNARGLAGQVERGVEQRGILEVDRDRRQGRSARDEAHLRVRRQISAMDGDGYLRRRFRLRSRPSDWMPSPGSAAVSVNALVSAAPETP